MMNEGGGNEDEEDEVANLYLYFYPPFKVERRVEDVPLDLKAC